MVVLADAAEFDELPVRHNENLLNEDLAKDLPLAHPANDFENPHVKAHLLLQAHFSHARLPMVDYVMDTKTLLDNAGRVLQALVDISASNGLYNCTCHAVTIMQMCTKARWHTDSPLLGLPGITIRNSHHVDKVGLLALTQMNDAAIKKLAATLLHMSHTQQEKFMQAVRQLPVMEVKARLVLGTQVATAAEGLPLVDADEEYEMEVVVTRKDTSTKGRSSTYKGKGPRKKEAGSTCIIIVGNQANDELVALKRTRVGPGESRSTVMQIYSPDNGGKQMYTVTVMGDSHLGLDVHTTVPFMVTESAM